MRKLAPAIAGLLLVALLGGLVVVQRTAAATVNGQRISRKAFYEALVARAGEEVLDELVLSVLIAQEAKRAKLSVSSAELETELNKIRDQVGGQAQLDLLLMQYGMTMDGFKQQIKERMLLAKLIEASLVLSAEDVEAFFTENRDLYDREEQVRARHILVETKAEADAIFNQLRGGADFAALAKEKSKDASTKDDGGDLGTFSRGDMVEAFSLAAFALQPGETSRPVKATDGWHVIRCEQKFPAEEAVFAQIADQVKKDAMAARVQDRMPLYVEELKGRASINYYIRP
ncbi:MAG: peptidylprolyl isomerase [Bacillota bacterium]